MRFEIDFVGTFAQPPVVITMTTSRVVEGARKGNLTLNGTYDTSTLIARQVYHGVICP